MSLGIAILRYRLFAIDIIINRALVYGTLSGLLALIYGLSVVAVERLVSALTGAEQSNVAVAAATLSIAVLFQPLRVRTQAFIDRRFYRQKYDAARAVTGFGVRVRDEVDIDRLSESLIAVVDKTLQPAHVALWLRDKDLPRL